MCRYASAGTSLTPICCMKQGVGVQPVLGELPVLYPDDVGASDSNRAADSVRGRAGKAAVVGPFHLPPDHQVVLVGDRADIGGETHIGDQQAKAAAEPLLERPAPSRPGRPTATSR